VLKLGRGLLAKFDSLFHRPWRPSLLPEASMNQDKSVALWGRGREAWNAWAEDMLRQKA
jgi:hypothetical protein